MESNYFPKAEMMTVQEIINYPLRNRGELDWYKKKLKDLRDLESSVKGVPKKSETKDISLYKMNIFKNVPPKYLDTDDWVVKRKRYIKNNLNDQSLYVRNKLPKCCDYMIPKEVNKSAAIRNLPKILEYKKIKVKIPKNISTNVLDNRNLKTICHNKLKKSHSTVKDDNHCLTENNTLFKNNNNNYNTIPTNNNDNNANNESNENAENVENNNNESISNNNNPENESYNKNHDENISNNNNNVENTPNNPNNNNNNNENNSGNKDEENNKLLLDKLEKELNSIKIDPSMFLSKRKKLTEIDILIDEYRQKYGYNNELDLLLAEYDIVKEKRKEKKKEIELEEKITKENELKEKIRLEKERIAREQEEKKNRRYENLVAEEENKNGLNQNIYSDNNLDNYEPYNEYNDYKKISIPQPEEKPLILPRITKNFIKNNIKFISEIQKPKNLSKTVNLNKKKKKDKIPEYIIQNNIEREIALREKLKKEEEMKSKRENLLTDAERVQILNSLVMEKEELEKDLEKMNVIDRSVTIKKIKINLDVRLDEIDRQIDVLAKKVLNK